MTTHDAFEKREKALEKAYFSAQDALLLEHLRTEALLGDVAAALREKLHVDDSDLLQKVQDLGITTETGAALLMAPLVHVAWIDGVVTGRERKAVLDLAASRGIEEGSPSYDQLVQWLDERPPAKVFDTALDVINAGLSVLPVKEREQRKRRVAHACATVAAASGGLAGLFGLGGEISDDERQLLETIAKRLHEHPPD